MNTIVRLIALTLLAASVATPAFATKILKWTDAKGVVHFGNTIPPSETGQGSQTLNSAGIPVAKQDSQATAAAAAVEAKRLAEVKRVADAQAEQDRRLMDSYTSEADITRDYQQSVELLDQQISATQVDIDGRQKSLAKLVATAGESERAGKPVSEQIKLLIINERTAIENQKKYIATRQAARATSKTEFDAKLARYRAVVARNSRAK
jgi:hypothetical protein